MEPTTVESRGTLVQQESQYQGGDNEGSIRMRGKDERETSGVEKVGIPP
jgi:hypothetical protein